MTRYRVTVRGTDIELRGYIDGDKKLIEFASALSAQMDSQDPMVVSSPAEDDYDPFRVVPARVDLAIEAIARAHRNMGLAINGLLAAIGVLIKAQEQEMNRPEPEVETAASWRQLAQDIVDGNEDALLARLPPDVAEAMARDRAR